jgi:hypothetical protein
MDALVVLLSLALVGGFGYFLWKKIKAKKTDDTGSGSGGGGGSNGPNVDKV